MHQQFSGDVDTSEAVLETYARDVSNFYVKPQAVYYPKTVADVSALVREAKVAGVSVTARAGGTCMSGGPLNSGWIVDLTRHLNGVTIDPVAQTATVEAGAYFRDIEDAAKEHGLMFGAYPSSHRMCGIGGMLGNNASGEKSLRFGPTSENTLELEVVLADGLVVTLAPKALAAATSPREQALLELHAAHGAHLRHAIGDVKKSASGYRLDALVAGDTYNEVPLMCGAQGTLGIITKAVLRLVPIPQHTALVVISGQTLEDLPAIVAAVSLHNPESLETFDSNTFARARQFLVAEAAALLPYVDPAAHLFILAQFSEDSETATINQATACLAKLQAAGFKAELVHEPQAVAGAWQVRRNSFTLMRDHNPDGHRAVPCIEDVIVPLDTLGVFIHELIAILTSRKITYGFHGHIGDGSFRVVPVFDFSSPTLHDDIFELMEVTFALIKRLRGNTSADHSDGIIRTPFLEAFYGAELYEVFAAVKEVYDPEQRFNPHKKVGGTRAMVVEQMKV